MQARQSRHRRLRSKHSLPAEIEPGFAIDTATLQASINPQGHVNVRCCDAPPRVPAVGAADLAFHVRHANLNSQTQNSITVCKSAALAAEVGGKKEKKKISAHVMSCMHACSHQLCLQTISIFFSRLVLSEVLGLCQLRWSCMTVPK